MGTSVLEFLSHLLEVQAHELSFSVSESPRVVTANSVNIQPWISWDLNSVLSII